MFDGITDLSTFLVGTIIIILLPGPNSLYVMTLASRRGLGAGYRGACGIFVGDTILMALTALGAGSLLKNTPGLFVALQWAGALYLGWMGLGLLRGAIARWRSEESTQTSTTSVSENAPERPFRTALTISLMNPKAILFCLSFFVQFVAPDAANPALTFLVLGLIVQLCSALYLSILIFSGVRLAAHFRAQRRLAAVGTGTVGLLFMGFGARLVSA
jgi:leucine efflux protein